MTTTIADHSDGVGAGDPGASRSTAIRPHDATIVNTPLRAARSRLVLANHSETPMSTAYTGTQDSRAQPLNQSVARPSAPATPA